VRVSVCECVCVRTRMCSLLEECDVFNMLVTLQVRVYKCVSVCVCVNVCSSV